VKRFLVRLLAVFGLAPARLSAVARQPETTAPSLPQPAQDRKAEWKAKAGEAMARAKTFEAEARQQAKRAEKFRALADKLLQRNGELEKLQERLANAERDLAVAREHLMAIEVKLDILEGAANVLDARTRTAVRQQHSETGASV
jgi:hypothetical protein